MEQIYKQSNLVMSEITSRIIGCAIRVHRVLGPGYDEAYYHKALAYELVAAGLDVKREVEFAVYYGEVLLGTKRVDSDLPSAPHNTPCLRDSRMSEDQQCRE